MTTLNTHLRALGRATLGICIATLLTGLTLVSCASADVIFVPRDHPDIQSAVDASLNGDTIVLADGIYAGEGNRDISFQGKEITLMSAFGPANCIIDAGGDTRAPHRCFIFESGETTASVLDGLTIRGGTTLAGAVNDAFNGGGILFRDSSATVRDCVISGNKCGCWGAGVYCNSGSHPFFINCDLSDNHADDDGGAVFIWNGGSITLVNCTMNNNTAVQAGGAICDFGSGGEINAINCSLVNNSAPFGAAIFGSEINVFNSIVWGLDSNALIYSNWATVSNSIVEGGYAAGTAINKSEPEFVDAANYDFRLMPGSPAIDAGDNSLIPADVTDMDGDGDTTEPIPFDYNYRSRFVDDPDTVDSGHGMLRIADIGAFEFQPGPMVVTPETYLLTKGTHVSGGTTELATSDNADLSLRRSTVDVQSRTEFEINGVSAVAFPIALQVELEGSVFARSTVTQTIELFNFSSGNWEQVDSRAAQRVTDQTVTVEATGDLARFVESGTQAVRARVRYRSQSQRQNFSSNTDQFQWTIE